MTGTAVTVPKRKKEQLNYKQNNDYVKFCSQNRWPEILIYFGIPESILSGKHEICPFHGGKDFHFKDDNGKGDWICTCTSGKFNDGFNLLSQYLNIDNKEAFRRVAEYLGLSSSNATYSPPDESELNRITAEYRKQQAEKEQEQEQEKTLSKKEAARHTKNILENCAVRPHDYLKNKGINQTVLVNTKNYKGTGKQTIYANALIIPVYDVCDNTKLIGAQFINVDGTRVYITGTPIADGVNILEGDSSLPYIGVAEGYASGLSVHMVTGATVVIAFDANGMKGKAERLKDSFSGKQLVFFGDNDSQKQSTGNHAAHTAAFKTNGLAVIPLIPGNDWDDYRKDNGIEKTKEEINRQLAEHGSLNITDKVAGLSINSSIFLASKKAVSFDDALTTYTNEECICPISKGSAIINAGAIWSYTLKKHIIPILVNLYDQKLIDECREINSLKKRLKWVKRGETQKHLYALIILITHRLGADLPNYDNFNDYIKDKTGLKASLEILHLIKCLQESRINQAKELIKLEPKEFKHHLLKQVKQKDGTFKLNWQPAIDAAKSGKYKLIAVKAQHGQGKTQEFIKNLFNKDIVLSHRAKLVIQTSKEFGCFDYGEYNHKIMSGFSLTSINGLAICVHSLKHDHFIQIIKQAHSVFIDEASQVLKTIHTDNNIDESVLPNIIEATKDAKCIYLTDADLTTQDIKHYQEMLGIKDDDVLVITAEIPERDYTVKISCSAAQAHYQTKVIEAIKKDLQDNIPCVLAVEGEMQGRKVFKHLEEEFPQKNIVFLSGKMPTDELNPFIDSIVEKTSTVDVLIHTSIIGTGVSVQHEGKRFEKGYGLFSGNVLSATECLQMMRRFRDITSWEVGLLCRPDSMLMTSYYKNLGAQELNKRGIIVNNILSDITINKERNKALFIHAFVGLLRDEYGFKIIGQFAATESIAGMPTTADIREEDKESLINATPLSLDNALLARKRGYRNAEERCAAESAICKGYFKIAHVSEEAAEIWCNPLKLESFNRQEKIIKIIRLDSSIPFVQKTYEILILAGVTLALFKTQRLNQESIKELRDSIASECGALYGDGLLIEKYCKASRIPTNRPMVFIKEFLLSIGLDVDRTRAREGGREYQLDVTVSPLSISKFNLDTRTDKEKRKDEARKLKADGLSYRLIGERLFLTKLQVQQLLK